GHVVSAGVDTQFLHKLGSRGWKDLPYGVVYRAAGLGAVIGLEALAGIKRKARGCDSAGGIPVEKIVGAGSVDGKAVAGSALSISPDGLVAKAGVAAGAVQK